MTVSQHISSLLYQFDCVIIPGFGGFVANYHPAQINKNEQLLFPPSKGLIFNKNLQNNDGLLADSISRTEQISYAESVLKIEHFVQNVFTKLREKKRISIEEIGYLIYDEEQNIQFVPEYSANFLVDAFGLYPVVAKEIIRTQETKVKEPELTQEKEKINPIISVTTDAKSVDENTEKGKIIPIQQKSIIRKYWPAAAVLVPLAFYSYWIPFKTDVFQSGKLEFSDLNPFHQRSTFYQERKSKSIILEVEEKNDWLQVIENAGGPVAKLKINDEGAFLNVFVIEKPVAESTRVKDNLELRLSKKIHIIGGCFKDLANAEKMVSDLKTKGYQSYILDQNNGLNRVVIESYVKKDDAVKQLNKIRQNEIPGAWILEK